MESLEVMGNGVESCNAGLVQLSNNVNENDNREVDIIEDFDSYWQDINDRLTISRMVSESVIKGMVNAVTQEAAEKISQKELEVTQLKERLHIYQVGADESEFLGSLAVQRESNGTKDRRCIKGTEGRMHRSFLESVVEHDRIEESLGSLRGSTKEQFKKLKKEIDSIRGCSSIKKIGSSSQLGLGDILQDKVSDRWIDVDRTVDSLKSTIEIVYQQVEGMVHLSKASVCEWQLEQEFKAEIEALVMRNCIRSVEEKNWDRFCGDKNVNWHGRMEEISSLRQELDVIFKSLSVSDNGQLSSHGSLEGEEDSNNYKKGDRSHRKVLSNLKSSYSLPAAATTLTSSSSSSSSSTLSSSSLWEENGKHDESEINTQEHLDHTRLMHMSKEDLIIYHHNEMTKLKRNHESTITNLTEEHFSHIRELLRERGPSLSSKKNKEFDTLRRRISEVISKLDEILVENEEVATFDNNEESLSCLKDRLESLLLENHQLRDLLTDKKREVKCPSLQLSKAAEKMSQHSLAEEELLKTTVNLKSAIEDARIEALIGADAFACILGEMVDQIGGESQMEYNIMQESNKSILNEAAHNAEPANQCEIEDLNMELLIMQAVYVVIFKEALKDAEEKLNNLNMKYINENELRVSLEMEKLEKGKQLEVEVVNKERLKQEVLSLTEEKEQLAQDATAALEKEKERYDLAAQVLDNLRDETCRQQKLISESIEESKATKVNLAEALEQIERHKSDKCKLDQKLELAMKELREVDEERRMLDDVNQERQNAVSLFETKERVLKEQMDSIAVYIHGLLKAVNDFECKITQDISGKCSRLKSLSYQLHLLKQKANVLVRRGLLYKQRLEKKCSDLEKAEAEVDLLGDEVDTLLSLVEKIYIALDHYSPILQHYPGITEILKLVRRELRGETKPV